VRINELSGARVKENEPQTVYLEKILDSASYLPLDGRMELLVDISLQPAERPDYLLCGAMSTRIPNTNWPREYLKTNYMESGISGWPD
jgi:hypothetical protein